MSNDWIKNYILLALRIDKAVRNLGDWFVDCYYGPKYLKRTVEKETIKSSNFLLKEAIKLDDSLKNQAFTSKRKNFLKKQVKAMRTITRILDNKDISLEEQIETCLDIEFKWVSEEHFERGLKLYDQGLPGKGNIRKRYTKWNNMNQFSTEKVSIIKNIIEDVLLELRKRTKSLFDLPVKEEVDVSIVTEKNWGAANWYLGDFNSLMELNIDYPVNLFSLVPLLCHEIYPGHHTEFSFKEKYLVSESECSENQIFIINSPQLFIAEGIAEVAFEIIFTCKEAANWLEKNIYKKLNIKTDDVNLNKLFKASRINAIDQISGNVIIMLNNECSRDEIVKYIKKYTLRSEETANKLINSLQSSPYKRIYNFSYFWGKRLIKRVMKEKNEVEIFKRLLKEQVYPSLLKEWLN
ncbi:hypothetical protein JCM16358_08230 [Halanaerocella petrolearia]